MAENKNIVIRLMADTASYEAAMTRAGSTAKTVASGMENTGRKSALIASGMTAAGLAVAAFGVAAVKMAADFDQQMSTVQANTGATGAQLDQLRAAAIEAGASTVYSASDSADAINDLGKAGMSVTDILTGGLSGALNLAASDGMAVGDAADLQGVFGKVSGKQHMLIIHQNSPRVSWIPALCGNDSQATIPGLSLT